MLLVGKLIKPQKLLFMLILKDNRSILLILNTLYLKKMNKKMYLLIIVYKISSEKSVIVKILAEQTVKKN